MSARQLVKRAIRRPRQELQLRMALRKGMPAVLEPPLRFLISGRLPGPEDERRCERVEQLRAALAARSGEHVSILYSPKPGSAGAVATAEMRPDHGEVQTFDLKRVAEQTSVRADVGQLMYMMARAANAETIVELGACAGIGSSYLASTQCPRFIGIEGSTDLAEIAQHNVSQVAPQGRIINALFDDALDDLLPELADGGVDVVWVDGHHEKIATIHYFQRLVPVLNRSAFLFFDDIRWSQDMYDGWNELRAWPGFAETIDLGTIGMGIWQGGDAVPRQWDMSVLRGRGRIAHPAGWS